LDTKKTLPIMLVILGLIFLSGGVAAYYGRTGRAAACEACGMEIERTDPSTFTITTPDGVTRYGCCPMCSLMIGAYYRNTAVAGKCFECGKAIGINILNGDLTDATPVGPPYNISIILGKSCVTRKIFCSSTCAHRVRTSQDWARDLPIVPLATAFRTAKENVPKFTIVPRQVRVPEISYVLIGLGLVLIALSPISWKLLPKKCSLHKTAISTASQKQH